MGGGGGGSQKTETEVTPWQPAQEDIKRVLAQARQMQQAQGQYSGVDDVYAGDRVADLTPDQQRAQEMLRRYATGDAQRQVQNAQSTNEFLMSPDLLNPDSNPYLQQTAEAAMRPVTEQFNQQILPNIGSRAVSQGAYTGARPSIQQSIAANQASRNMSDASASIYSNAYQQGLQTMGNAVSRSGQLLEQGTFPAEMLGSIGDANQRQAQFELDAERQEFEERRMEPVQRLEQYADLVLRSGQMGSSTTGTQEQPGTNRVAGALGGAATGAGVASALSMTGPAGWAVVGAGAMLGAFG